MDSQYHVVFTEQNNTGASQLAASIMATLTPTHFAVNFAILNTHNASLPRDSIHDFIAPYQGESLGAFTMANLKELSRVDLMIGLVLANDSQDFVAQMREMDTQKNVGISAYWDLTHLAMNDPEAFSAALHGELLHRIELLVDAQM